MSLHERCELEAQQAAGCKVFLNAFDRLVAMGVNVSDSKFARGNYAPKAIVEKNLAEGFTEAQLAAAMNQLLAEGRLMANQPVGWSGSRNKLFGLVRVDL